MTKLARTLFIIGALQSCGSSNDLSVSGKVTVEHKIVIDLENLTKYFREQCLLDGTLNLEECQRKKVTEFLDFITGVTR